VRCRVCRDKAVIDIRRHNAGFCREHFLQHIHNQVARTIQDFDMFDDDRLLVAVSGGKDSLAVWDILLDLGYDATGFYLDLGIGGYSRRSRDAAVGYAHSRSAKLIVRSLSEEHGYTVPELSRLLNRVACSGCGLNKRYEFNRVALQEGFDVLVTGHNLDDEVATLLGNVLHWNMDLLARQAPVLEERVLTSSGAAFTAMVRKVKPLVRIAERETAAYALLRGIDYIVEECPMVAGNTQHRYKEAITLLEERSPGTKHQMYFGFLERARPRLAQDTGTAALVPCSLCKSPTVAGGPGEPVCSFCKTKALARRRKVAGGHKPPAKRRRTGR
jgi:tRNA-5-methyluridine54 2-sulfurtransferase